MTRNMGTADRVIRVIVAIGIVALYLAGSIGGLLAIVLGVVAVGFLITAFVGNCPAYVPLGISTRRHEDRSVRV